MLVGADGRVSFSTATAPNDTYISGFRCDPVTGAIRALDAAPVLYSNGYGFTASNQLCISTAGAIAGYHAGLSFTVDGRLCVDGSAPITNFNGGYPMAAGRLAASGVEVVAPSKTAKFTGTAGQTLYAGAKVATGPNLVVQLAAKFSAGAGDLGLVTIGQNNGAGDIVYWAYRPGNNEFRCWVQNEQPVFVVPHGSPVPPFTAAITYFRLTLSLNAFKWESSTDGTTWAQISAGTIALNTFKAGTTPIRVGCSGGYFDSGCTSWKGEIARVQVWSDLAMTQQLWDCDPSKYVSGLTFTSGGNVWDLVNGVTIS